MPRPTRFHRSVVFAYRAITLYGAPFQMLPLTPTAQAQPLPNDLWAVPGSLIATAGISIDFFSSGYLDISVPRVRLTYLCIQYAIASRAGWVSPFGNPRIKVCCRLPEAYRRLPRPSSPSAAKASTECANSLDHITQSARMRIRSMDVNVAGFLPVIATLAADHTQRAHGPLLRRTISFLLLYFFGLSIPS